VTKGQIILARTEIGSEKSLDGFEVRRDRSFLQKLFSHLYGFLWMEEQDKG
jgi:hypothetical protein